MGVQVAVRVTLLRRWDLSKDIEGGGEFAQWIPGGSIQTRLCSVSGGAGRLVWEQNGTGGEVHVAVVGMGQITSGLTSHGKDLAFTLSEMGAV